MKNSFLKNIFILYTCLFLLLLPIVFLPFIMDRKTFIWAMDGIDQHYPSLIYFGKLLRGILAGKGFPMVDFSVGMGFDTITTLNYYALGDPINLLTIFMNANNAVYFYNFLILFRFYLAGIGFLLLMRYFLKNGSGIVLGALIYVYSGFSLYAGIRHPFFMNPMIYLPFIIIGIERVLRGKKPYLLITMTFISTLSNFYFLYILTIIIGIYILLRYFTVYRVKDRNLLLGLIQTGFKTGGYYLLGVAFASVLFIPVLYAFSRNGRLNISPSMISGSYLYYDLSYYARVLQGFFSPGTNPGYWTVLSISGVLMVSIAIMLVNKQFRILRLIYLLAFAGLFLPAFGYLMNGFSYVSNRWCFLISLLIAVTFTLTYDHIFRLKRKEVLLLLFELLLYAILAFFIPSIRNVKITFYVLAFITGIILILQIDWFKNRRVLGNLILYILVFFSLGVNGYGLYSGQYSAYSHQFLNKEAVRSSQNGPVGMIKKIPDNSFYRVETYGDNVQNESMILGYHDVSGYFSLMDGDVTSYLIGLEVLNQITAYEFYNLDNRTILGTLAGVKYFATNNKAATPYGYALQKEAGAGSDQLYLYRNTNVLPFGYTYHQYILRKDYEHLSALEKQNAMLNAVVLGQDTEYANKTNKNTGPSVEKLDLTVVSDKKVSLNDHKISVKRSNAEITLLFHSRPNSETYIRLGKLNITQKDVSATNLHIKANSINKRVVVRSPYYNSYFGKENYLINLGYTKSGITKAVITFPTRVNLSYDSIEAYSVEMGKYEEQVSALSENALDHIKQGKNLIEGDITLNKKGILLLSIPYSKGWNAYVDGIKSVPLEANVMYMALPLDAGSHHIVLKYATPYLRLGFFISLAAFIILMGIIIHNNRGRNS